MAAAVAERVISGTDNDRALKMQHLSHTGAPEAGGVASRDGQPRIPSIDTFARHTESGAGKSQGLVSKRVREAARRNDLHKRVVLLSTLAHQIV